MNAGGDGAEQGLVARRVRAVLARVMSEAGAKGLLGLQGPVVSDLRIGGDAQAHSVGRKVGGGGGGGQRDAGVGQIRFRVRIETQVLRDAGLDGIADGVRLGRAWRRGAGTQEKTTDYKTTDHRQTKRPAAWSCCPLRAVSAPEAVVLLSAPRCRLRAGSRGPVVL